MWKNGVVIPFHDGILAPFFYVNCVDIIIVFTKDAASCFLMPILQKQTAQEARLADNEGLLQNHRLRFLSPLRLRKLRLYIGSQPVDFRIYYD
jgi:hypothetical protein